MPTYQYVCTECGTPLEVVQSFTDDALVECPTCGGRLRKVFSAVGVVFKGSGFYRNDSREKSTAGATTKSSTDSKSSSDGKSASDGASGAAGKDSGAKKDSAASATPASSSGSSGSGTSTKSASSASGSAGSKSGKHSSP